MKTIVNKFLLLSLASFALWSCQEQKLDFETGNLVGVSELIAPVGDEITYLRNSGDMVAFEWKTVASGAVKYEIVFYATATGAEIYRHVPEDGAPTGKASVSLSILDQIASLAGILTASEGDIYWNVNTKKGMAEAKATATAKKLPVKRFSGFAQLPVHLYITGGATEGGTDITAAQEFRNDEANVFCIYTSLKADEPFWFANNNSGTGYNEYSYDKAAKIYVENGDPMTVDADGIYRITVNIVRNRCVVELLENLRLFYPEGMDVEGTTVYEFPMEYQGGGVWKLEDFKFAFTDNRYHFRLDVAGKPSIWGSKDASPSVGTVIGGSYYYISENYVQPDDYEYSYKLMSPLLGLTTDVYVDMSASAPQTTHRFALSSDFDLQPVASLTAPAADASIDLNDSFTLDFTWEKQQYDESLFPAKYEVVFFADAAGEEEIGSVTSGDYGLSTAVTVNRAILDNMAKETGAEIGAQGTVYWSVRTIMLNDNVIAVGAPRKLDITRIQLPVNLYISGAATENLNVANALKMRKLEDGVFQGYYSFNNNAGGIRLTDGTSGQYRTYAYTEGVFIPQEDATISTTGWASSSSRQYRITINFKENTIATQVIRLVYLYQTGGNNFQLTYVSNGVWRNSNFIKAAGDNRYLFRVSHTNSNPANGESPASWVESWCSAKWDNSNAPTSSTDLSFWYITVLNPSLNSSEAGAAPGGYQGTPRDRWAHAFKWINGHDTAASSASIEVNMNADNPYHKVTKPAAIATPN